jgi:hypothetical protein
MAAGVRAGHGEAEVGGDGRFRNPVNTSARISQYA